MVIKPFPHNDTFWCLWVTSLITSNFSFSHSVFFRFRALSGIFIKFKIVVCRLFQFGPVWNLSSRNGLNVSTVRARVKTKNWMMNRNQSMFPLIHRYVQSTASWRSNNFYNFTIQFVVWILHSIPWTSFQHYNLPFGCFGNQTFWKIKEENVS